MGISNNLSKIFDVINSILRKHYDGGNFKEEKKLCFKVLIHF